MKKLNNCNQMEYVISLLEELDIYANGDERLMSWFRSQSVGKLETITRLARNAYKQGYEDA